MNVRFEYSKVHTSEAAFAITGQRFVHTIQAFKGAEFVGHMVWTGILIRDIDVVESYRRRGVATALWNEAQRLAAGDPEIPEPRHSPARTDDGDAWAMAVGGALPERDW